jgi:hypothetical protein
LVIDGNGATTGNYAFRLLEVSKQAVLPLDLVQTGILDPGFSSLVFRLDGASGRRLFYDGMGANSRGNSTLYGPANDIVASANLINDFTAVLNRSGEYVLVLDGSSADPVQDAPQATAGAGDATSPRPVPMTLNAMVNVSAAP